MGPDSVHIEVEVERLECLLDHRASSFCPRQAYYIAVRTLGPSSPHSYLVDERFLASSWWGQGLRSVMIVQRKMVLDVIGSS